MRRRICIAGSGKIGRDAGMYFLTRGHDVTWVSGGEERLVDLQGWVTAHVHRFMKHSAGFVGKISASFALYGELEGESFDVVFECGRELRNAKREMVVRLAPHCSDGSFLLTASSSILPSDISSSCVGLHVFYPMELTRMAELVVPPGITASRRDGIVAFCKESGLAPMLQDEANAFAVNRMLLPLQNEVFRALAQGVSLADADTASVSRLCAIGMCELAKKVGPAVVAASVENYRGRMDAAQSGQFEALAAGLAAFDASRDLWTSGRKLPAAERINLARTLYYLLINTCLRFVERGEISAADLNSALDAVFGASATLEQAVSDATAAVIASTLREARGSGGAEYFEPSVILDRMS